MSNGRNAAPAAGSSWTPERDAKLTALWAEGLSGAEIARRMGTTKNAVVGRVHRLKLPSRPSPLRPTLSDWPAEDDAALRSLRAAGHSAPEIARRLGRTGYAVLNRIAQLGLRRRSTNEGAGAVVRARSHGVAPLRARGAAALARAQANSIGAAEGCRTRGAQGDAACGGAEPGPAAHPIPAGAGDPTAGGSGGHPCDVTGDASLKLPPPVPPAGAFSGGAPANGCCWPMWRTGERPTHLYCGAPRSQRPDGSLRAWCETHAARALVVPRERDMAHQVTRSTFAWGGKAA